MSRTAVVMAAEDGGPAVSARFVDSMVARLHAEYGVDQDRVRCLAMEVLGTFATARVQAFVPILVEKQLRVICRAVRNGGGPARQLSASPVTT